ncbi:MAG TPA: efflux transporter periplasmic adaptor subunit, partial [Xanthomonadaceae bacterium]|nr:efflux transporter periplasmic adaptor subunit [Xanthomonadaceae bacterium]
MPRVPSVVAALAAAVLALAACGRQPAEAPRKDQAKPTVVTTAVLAPRPFHDALQALGTAQAQESVAITAKVSDVVTRLAFDSGQRVRAGQLLADM